MDPALIERLSHMSRDELAALNRWIVRQLRNMSEREAQDAAREIFIGDEVRFRSHDNQWLQGRVVRVNRKTVTIDTERGTWRVHPSFVQQVRPTITLPPDAARAR